LNLSADNKNKLIAGHIKKETAFTLVIYNRMF